MNQAQRNIGALIMLLITLKFLSSIGEFLGGIIVGGLCLYLYS